MLTELPKSKDIMENPMGFPTSFELPIIKDLTKYHCCPVNFYNILVTY